MSVRFSVKQDRTALSFLLFELTPIPSLSKRGEEWDDSGKG